VSGSPDFIFMLTRNDVTVPDALAHVGEAMAAGVRHVGFKDVGLTHAEELTSAIRAAGARIYLEVVSSDAESEQRSAEAAVRHRVDVLMGGARPNIVLPIIAGSGIGYFPFPGAVSGHPSVLTGTCAEIVASAKRLAALDGVTGLDLLAWRFAGDALDLIDQVVRAIAPKPVIVAGSIDRRERLAAARDAGAAGFTIGTAVFEGAFAASPRLADQLIAIQAMLAPPPGREFSAMSAL
jgi:hypothetical protein